MRTVKKTLCLVLVLSMMLGLCVFGASAKFVDADKITGIYTEAAEVLNAIGVLTGFEDGTFRPDGNLTREQACAIVARLMAFSGVSMASSFTDSHEWSDGYIAFCEQMKIVAGYGDGRFGPEDTLTGGQFMKMLLVALGYDPIKESLQNVGDPWIINVARLGKTIGLDADIENFPYLEAITREQAAQLALNAIKSPLVQYSGAGNVEYVTTTIAKEQRISTQKLTNSNSYTVELGERYFPNLVLNGDSDAFYRPANRWVFNNTVIGAYAKIPDLVYKNGIVTPSQIYLDLGLAATVTADKVFYYVDGEQIGTQVNGGYLANAAQNGGITYGTIPVIARANTDQKIGGNGALTEVYYDVVTGEVTIVVVNTYTGTIGNVYAETTTKPAYVTLAAGSYSMPNGKDALGARLGWVFGELAVYPDWNKFETTAFAKNDVVTYTYSFRTAAIESMQLANKVTGKLTNFTGNLSVTLDSTTYYQNYKGLTINDDISNKSKLGTDIDIYLDEYGYVVKAGLSAHYTTYAVIAGYGNTGNFNVGDNAVKLFFTATGKTNVGGVGSVTQADSFQTVQANKTFHAAKISDKAPWDENFQGFNDGYDADIIDIFDIVSYSGEGPYSISEVVADAYEPANKAPADDYIIKRGASTLDADLFDSYGVGPDAEVGNGIIVNGSTNFAIMMGDKDNANFKYYQYTGIANVPNVKVKEGATLETIYVAVAGTKSGNVVTATNVFVYCNSDEVEITSSNDKVVFIIGNNNSLTMDANGVQYYEYKAVVDGALATIKVAPSYGQITVDTLVYNPQYDTNSRMVAANEKAIPTADYAGVVLNGEHVHYGISMTTPVNYVAVFADQEGANAIYAIKSDVKVQLLEGEGDNLTLTNGDYNTLLDTTKVSTKDRVWYKLEKTDNGTYLVSEIFVEKRESFSQMTQYIVTLVRFDPTTNTVNPSGSGIAVQVKKTDGTYVTNFSGDVYLNAGAGYGYQGSITPIPGSDGLGVVSINPQSGEYYVLVHIGNDHILAGPMIA